MVEEQTEVIYEFDLYLMINNKLSSNHLKLTLTDIYDLTFDELIKQNSTLSSTDGLTILIGTKFFKPSEKVIDNMIKTSKNATRY